MGGESLYSTMVCLPVTNTHIMHRLGGFRSLASPLSTQPCWCHMHSHPSSALWDGHELPPLAISFIPYYYPNATAKPGGG